MAPGEMYMYLANITKDITLATLLQYKCLDNVVIAIAIW